VHAPTGPPPGRALRICANNSTFDAIQTSVSPQPSLMNPTLKMGTSNSRHRRRRVTKWGQICPSCQ
jgi:hypothetical protein